MASEDVYDAEGYWAERYRAIDITKSGHIDLPVPYNRWLYRRKKERLRADLDRAGFTPAGASILECGAGTGVYVEMWRDLGCSRLMGLDISANAVASLVERFPEYEFHKRDMHEPALETLVGEGYDLVTTFDMLYHLVDDDRFEAALASFHKVLRPGGLFATHDLFLHHGAMGRGYIKWRSLREYETALAKHGFEIVSRTPTFFFTVQAFDSKPAWVARFVQRYWAYPIRTLISRFPNIMGFFGYWSDRAMGTIYSEGPSFEVLVCRRID